jgi:2-succinyl-6-hydroxy-2,4-cyclohexadiene-1-carboxylate synthase
MLASKGLKTGPGTPIVFFHGFLGTGADWEAVCTFLPPIPCIAFDLPGHGASPFMEEFVIDIPRFHLVGYSMGGRIAVAYAAKHPAQIASLTLLSTHPGLKTDEEKQSRFESDSKWAQLLHQLSIDDFLLRWYDQPIFKTYRPDLKMRREQNIPNLARALMHYSLSKQKFTPLDGVLVGENDLKFRALFCNPVVVPNAGHMVHLENPQFIAQTLEKNIL